MRGMIDGCTYSESLAPRLRCPGGFQMQGDDLSILLFWLTLAVTFGYEAVKAETAVRRGILGSLASVFLLCGIFWLQIKKVWPPLTEYMASIATSPQSWFVLFIFISAIVVFGGRKKRVVSGLPSNDALDNALQGLFERVGRIEKLPSAVTIDDHRDLRTTVINFMKDYLADGARTTEQIKEVIGRLDAIENKMSAPASHPETNRDLLLLMHFMVYQSTVLMLDDLLKSAPEGIFDGPLQLGGDFEHQNSQSLQFIASARSKLDHGSFRRSELENTLYLAEGEAERRLEATPVDQRPTGIDPLVLRRWTITHLQCAWAIEFLRRQRSDAEGNLLNQRHGLLERYRIRNPN